MGSVFLGGHPVYIYIYISVCVKINIPSYNIYVEFIYLFMCGKTNVQLQKRNSLYSNYPGNSFFQLGIKKPAFS